MRAMASAPDKRPSDLEASDYIVHLWDRRWATIAVVLLAFAGTYVGLRLFHVNLYESRALVMVRSQPRTTNMEFDKKGLEPPSFKSMFTADETILFVRNQYNDMVKAGRFAGDEGHEEFSAPLEKYRERFKVESVTQVDTTIITEFSPVMELRVRGNSRGQAKALTELWLNHILEKYGNLVTEEAQFRVELAGRKSAQLSAELGEAVKKREALVASKRVADAEVASALRRLTSAPIPDPSTYVDNDILAYNVYTGPREANISVDAPAQQGGDPGLLEEHARLLKEFGEVSASHSAESVPVAEIRGRLERNRAQLEELQREIASASDRTSGLAAQIAAAEVDINRLQYAVRVNSGAAADAEALLSLLAADAEGDAKYSTLRVLARPQLPDLRVWPKRMLISGLAAGAVFALALLVFCGERYLRCSLRA